MDLKLELFQKVETCFSQAEAFFETELSRPQIRFTIRGQDAGRAYFPITKKNNKKNPVQTELRFNECLLEENPEKFIQKVVPHECAHLIVYELFGTCVKPHGDEWKAVMEGLFDVEPAVNHEFDVSGVANKPYIYRCQCPDHELPLSKRQHHQISKGNIYICRSCKSELHFSFHKPRLESTKKGKKEQNSGLYIYVQESLKRQFNQGVLERLTYIVNKKKFEQVYASEWICGNPDFQSWLKSQSLFRKLKMGLGLSDLNESVLAGTISHVVLIIENINDEEQTVLHYLHKQGIMSRTLKVDSSREVRQISP